MASRQAIILGRGLPRQKPAIEPVDKGVECTPQRCINTCGACIMFMMSVATVTALGVIAGGAWWTAQGFAKLTDPDHFVTLYKIA